MVRYAIQTVVFALAVKLVYFTTFYINGETLLCPQDYFWNDQMMTREHETGVLGAS